ncbi:competence type IV pilus minor pilin ComGF [Virgibacillus byunsanensis]|uniref:Competence type IV pilus minor pilin ComGF n=1 Tax=Virgibacillus byunsanensis TaxID=570945 RepID=A0ABW3LJD2_9BACI
MLKIKLKNTVFTAIVKIEKGFTILSVLLSITVLFITLPFAAYLVKTANIPTNYEELSIQQFFIFLRDEMIIATDIVVYPNTIEYTVKNGSQVTIEKYDNIIRRQVIGKGHEIYLRDVSDVTFTSLSYGIHVSITSLEGEHSEKDIIFYK